MARLSTLARFEVSGEILSEDTIALLVTPECKLSGAEIDATEFAIGWDLLSTEWQRIRQEVADYDTERLRRRWILLVLDILGHKPQFLRSHPTYAEDRTIPLTHRSGDVPMWLLDYKQFPDEKLSTGRRKSSPHELFQEYLDLTDDDWGIICNGRIIRLLHDYHKTLTRNYVEADLESMFEALDIDAFRAVWRIFRADSFKPEAKGVRPIEKLCEQSRQEGAEIGKELRKQVLEAIRKLGNGFLAADHSSDLRQALTSDPEAPTLFYQALLRIVYRLLFLLYIENKPGWTPSANPVWASSYSISRLRDQAEEATSTRADGEDHWEGLKVIFGIIRDGSEFFHIHPYGGELFDDGKLWHLDTSCLRNSDLLTAIRLLTFFEDKKKKVSYRVNFRTIRIDALGSVYEALLDVAPAVTPEGVFTFAEGTERKLTGSYYTPPELVAELIKSALVPVIEDRLKPATTKQEKEATLLAIKIVDPACGSGAFLVQALDKLSERLCLIRKEGEEPSELDIREARRDVVTHCIHGVDLNPMAVELCKFTLWLHVAHPKLPLSYLEPLIKCGNALVGVPLLSQVIAVKERLDSERNKLLKAGDRKAAGKIAYVGWPETVPDEAFDAVGGDDKKTSQAAKRRNKEQRTGQLTLKMEAVRSTNLNLAKAYSEILKADEDTAEAVKRKDARYRQYQQSEDYCRARNFADLWCTAFFWRLDDATTDITMQEWLQEVQGGPDRLPQNALVETERVQRFVRPFHWELEFPDVFAAGGFDCVLGNPPWERIKLQEEEFFASRAPEIAKAQNRAVRQKMIACLEETNAELLRNFQDARHAAEAESKFMRRGGRYPLTAVGDINTYALFAETNRNLLNPHGRAGMVVPTGIATDDTTKAFFGSLTQTRSLIGFIGLDNEGMIFPGIDHRNKFGLLCLGGNATKKRNPEFTFSCSQVAAAQDPMRRFTLSAEDFALLNPNTRTCPVFRTNADAELTKEIYRRIPILIGEHAGGNPWGIKFQAMFHMANDSGIFHNTSASDDLPLYEAKMIHQFDHRYATYEGATEANLAEGSLPQPSIERKADPYYTTHPRYWVGKHEVLKRVAQVPEGLVTLCYANAERQVSEIVSQWVVGWALNRGDKGDTFRAQLGEEHVRRISMSIMGSVQSNVNSYLRNELGLRALERLFPLTRSDINRVEHYADLALVQGEQYDWLGLAQDLIDAHTPKWLMGFRDVTNNSVERTAIFSLLPLAGVGHKFPLAFLSDSPTVKHAACFLANLNALVFDYVTRQKLSGVSLSYFILKQLPVLPQQAYDNDKLEFIGPRVVELVYTSWEMAPFAEAMGYTGPPFVWEEERRALIRAELDAYYARLYGLTHKQLRYILDPHGLSNRELEDILDPWEDPTCSGPHLLPENPTQDFPGETFRVLKNNEEKKYSEYRTRRLVLGAWARLAAELGPVKPVNYREMLEKETTSLSELVARPQPALKVAEEKTEYLVLVSPDYSPQEKLPFDYQPLDGETPAVVEQQKTDRESNK